MPDWPSGEQPGPNCPHAEAGDAVAMCDTAGCPVLSQWHDLCPCAAVLGGWNDEWLGFDVDGNELPRHVKLADVR